MMKNSLRFQVLGFTILQRRCGMPKITAEIPEELYRFLRGRIVDQRLEGEPTTVSTLVTNLLYQWKHGRLELRRRRGGALASPPKEDLSPGSDSVEARTVGQEIDEVLEELSQETRERQREILVSIARQLVRLEKLHRGG
jgi:hypothetical protein